MFNTDQKNYRTLRSIVKERTNPIVAWTGAGLSKPAGLPSWQELKDLLCTALQEKARYVPDPNDRKQIEIELRDIRIASDLWVAFWRLLERLGDTTYVSTIRAAFAQASSCEIPDNYKMLISMPISGIINLNIDRLATRAFSQQYPGKNIVEFSGKQCAEFTHLLKGGSPFIVNLHGIVEDRSSWVFNIGDLKWLYRQEGYIDFIKAVLCSKTVIYIGVNAQDIAVGGHIDSLKIKGIDFGAHFWITDRSDSNTDEWAEKNGLRLIHYKPDNDHQELREMFKDIHNFIPEDSPVGPVSPVLSTNYTKDLPLPEDLESMTDEDVRGILNAHAALILRTSEKQAYDDFERFCEKYDRYIYRSWYANTIPPYNIMLGYRLKEQIAEGAFGRVFEADDSGGQRVALKLLKYDVRHKPAMLQGFRRGVQSMRILDKHHVNGMIPYRNSSEIPAFAVMDFVDGPNLQVGVKSGFFDSWHDVLRIGRDLCAIIRSAHQLPERVLHRDIRPTNIMLRGYYTNPDDYEVVVLDFDLSWYRGASEDSVMDQSALNGFLAPEQIERTKGVSTRNATVDSFGLGMTLYFLRTHDEP